jgi:hypothetical protein
MAHFRAYLDQLDPVATESLHLHPRNVVGDVYNDRSGEVDAVADADGLSSATMTHIDEVADLLEQFQNVGHLSINHCGLRTLQGFPQMPYLQSVFILCFTV